MTLRIASQLPTIAPFSRFSGIASQPGQPVPADSFQRTRLTPASPRFASGEYLEIEKGGLDIHNGNYVYLSAPEPIRLNLTKATGQVESGESIRARNCLKLGTLMAPEEVRLENCPDVETIQTRELARLNTTTVNGNIEVLGPGKANGYHVQYVHLERSVVLGKINAEHAIIKNSEINEADIRNTGNIDDSTINSKVDVRGPMMILNNCIGPGEATATHNAKVTDCRLKNLSVSGRLQLGGSSHISKNVQAGSNSSIACTQIDGTLYAGADTEIQKSNLNHITVMATGNPDKKPGRQDLPYLKIFRNTTVNGDVEFKLSPGRIYLEEGSTIKGKVENAEIIHVARMY